MIKKQKYEWSEYQKAIFKDIQQGSGHTIVVARAGSSKTTALVEGSRYIPPGKKALFCAFNKSIQEELKERLSAKIECLTLHSLGFRGVRLKFGNVEVDYDKCWNIVEEMIGDPKHNWDLIDNICKTVSFCKGSLTDTPSGIDAIIDEYGLDRVDTPPEEFVKYVAKTLRLCKEKTNVVDFDDMIWFPHVYNINVGKYDFVFGDEVQDMNRAQIELALSAIKENGRFIGVLDNFQCIYNWRGAELDIINILKQRLNPKELSLPICYRCPRVVVERAQKYVPDIQIYEKAIPGLIKDIDLKDLKEYTIPNSFLLSRTNAPLIKQSMYLLRNGIPTNILGRDIGDGLNYLIKKSKKKSVPDLLKWLKTWEDNEKKALRIKNPKASGEVISDKADCIRMLCENAKDVNEVKENINKLFKDNDPKKIVTGSSIHRCKGFERERVIILADTLRESSQEEINIKYVAITRAKKELFFAWKNPFVAKSEEELWDLAQPID